MFFENWEIIMNVRKKITRKPEAFPKAARDLAEKDSEARVVSDQLAMIIELAVSSETISSKPKAAGSPIISAFSGKIKRHD